MRFYCEAYEVITEEKKVSFFYVDEKPLRYLLFDYIFLLVLAKKKYPNLMNCTPKVRFILSNFWGAVHFAGFFLVETVA